MEPTRMPKPGAIRLLGAASRLLPGDVTKTWVYLNLIAKPRKLLRSLTHTFYRMDVIYDVLREARAKYRGEFSILEFGSADGYSFVKMLYATKYLKMTDRVTLHAFDTFEGMPATDDARDQQVITGDGWVEGQFAGRYELLDQYCRPRYRNYRLHKGLFEDTLTDGLLAELESAPPLLVWIDCDYYTSSRTAFERLLPYLPNGCVFYFDDIYFNFGSRFTGEARLVWEINHGQFGDNLELVVDRPLSLDSDPPRCYRFIRRDNPVMFEASRRRNAATHVRYRNNGSPLP